MPGLQKDSIHHKTVMVFMASLIWIQPRMLYGSKELLGLFRFLPFCDCIIFNFGPSHSHYKSGDCHVTYISQCCCFLPD